MKNFLRISAYLLLFPALLYSQSSGNITGKVVDQELNPLPNLQLKLYIASDIYQAVSTTGGSFSFNNVTDAAGERLPDGYSVSENYPNPFNPATRIVITMPQAGKLKADVYNLLGQKVMNEIERDLNAGESYLDLELSGLPNGFYFARITLNNKYAVTKKLMLVYGSTHLSSSAGISSSNLEKSSSGIRSALETKIDSIVVTGQLITRRVFKDLPYMTGSSLDLGNLIIGLPPGVPQLSLPSNNAVDLSTTQTLSWIRSVFAESYTVQLSDNVLFSNLIVNENAGNAANYQISGLGDFKQYFWRVSALNSYGNSGWSTIFNFKTIVPAPVLSSPSNGAVNVPLLPRLFWNVSIAGATYNLQVSPNSSFTIFAFNESGLTNTNQELNGLADLTTYYWRVKATKDKSSSAWSDTWSFTTTGSIPKIPVLTYPANTAISIPTSPVLTWHTAFGATSYRVQVSKYSTFSSLEYEQSGITATAHQVPGLKNTQLYYWRVEAVNSYGSAWSDTWSFTTVVTFPQIPALSSPSNGAVQMPLTLTLYWNVSPAAESYVLQVSDNGEFSTFIFNQSGLLNTNQEITGLADFKRYYWRAAGTNSYGNSEWSEIRSFTTRAPSCPGLPSIEYEGKTYSTIQILDQCWLKQNLDVGVMINGNQNPANNGIVEKYCYNNSPNNCALYGAFYKWNEAMMYQVTPGSQGICPDGWHIPTQREFETLAAAVGNYGNALKGAGQGVGAGAGTNASGFSALLTGNRSTDYNFYNLTGGTYFWSSNDNQTYTPFYIYLDANNDFIEMKGYSKDFGFSVRCLKN